MIPNLHMQTACGSFDSLIKIDDVVDIDLPVVFKVNQTLMDSLNFYDICKKNNKKPIIGLNIYLAYGDCGSLRNQYGHPYSEYTLIAKNEIGYQNLIHISSYSYQYGFFQKPRVDLKFLMKHKEGIICLINSKKSEIYLHWKFKNKNGFMFSVKNMYSVFLNDLYVEFFEDSDLDFYEEVCSILNRHCGIASNIVKFMKSEDEQIYKCMYAINNNLKVDEINENFSNYSFKDEIKVPDHTIVNLYNLINQIEDYNLSSKDIKLPDSGVNKDQFKNKMFKLLQEKKLTSQVYIDRLNYELRVILEYGYHSYFEIVVDIINYVNKNLNGYISAGRGSVGGSLVAFLLGVTRINPVEPKGFGIEIPFDRFINAGRKVMPDIDMDFVPEDRQHVIEYLTLKWGSDFVKQMTTVVTLGARASLREVARVYGKLDFKMDEILKSFPKDQQLTLDVVRESSIYEQNLNNLDFKNLFDIALRLEGLPKNMGIHASGIALSSFNMDGVVPFIKHDSGKLATQYDQHQLDKIGVLKLDILGLTALKILRDTVSLINPVFDSNQIVDFLSGINVDDKEVFDFIVKGNLAGVFQWDTHSYGSIIKKLKPSSFKELVDLNAIGRPSALLSGLTDRYIKRKFGKEKIDPLHPRLKGLMEQTFDLPLYQEQTMQIFVSLAKYSLSEADDIRRAIGKKKPEILREQKGVFIKRCGENGIFEKEALEIFSIIEKFSKYAFNLGHAYAYARICYESVYLACHYPAYFYCANINNVNNASEVGHFISALNNRNVKIFHLDLNKSNYGYSVVDDGVLSGFAGLKYVSEKTARLIIDRRPYFSYKDFESKFLKKEINKRAMISLLCAGAFEYFFEKDKNDILLFEKRIDEKRKSILLNQYDYSGRIAVDPRKFFNEKFDTIKNLNEKKQIRIIAYVVDLREIYTKNNQKMAFAKIQDIEGRREIVIFPSTWGECRSYVKKNKLHKIDLVYNNGLSCVNIVAWED